MLPLRKEWRPAGIVKVMIFSSRRNLKFLMPLSPFISVNAKENPHLGSLGWGGREYMVTSFPLTRPQSSLSFELNINEGSAAWERGYLWEGEKARDDWQISDSSPVVTQFRINPIDTRSPQSTLAPVGNSETLCVEIVR